MKVAVVIVNWKVKDLLRGCLQSVYAESGLNPSTLEVIVIDNDSGDGSVEMVRSEFPQVTLVANADNVGFGAANNQALALTDAPVLILLNPDTVVLKNALNGMVERLLREPDLSIIGCRLLNGDGSLQRWTGGAFPNLRNVAAHYLFLDRLLPARLRPAPLYLNHDVAHPIDVDWVSGACMAIRREALKEALFDRRFFMYAEDMELCQRMAKTGWRVSYDPNYSIVHYQGASIQQQSTGIMLSSLKGPRYFFMLQHGTFQATLLDLLTVSGFMIRYAGYTGLAIFRPGRNYGARARLSRYYLGLALRVMFKR